MKKTKLVDNLLIDIRKMSFEEQINAMRKWFLENHDCPSYLWEGEPEYQPESVYDLYETLIMFFGEYADNDAIGKLASDLSYECPSWRETTNLFPSYYDNLIPTNSEYYESFKETIRHIEKVLKIEAPSETKEYLLSLLHINIITAIETYLSDAFIKTVMSNIDLLKRFVSKNKDFKENKICFSNIYDEYENIDKKVKKHLSDLMWHNISKLIPLYKFTLNVDLANEYKDHIIKAILIRHDLVHRGGKTINGDDVTVTEADLTDLLEKTSLFISKIDKKIEEQKKVNFIDLDDMFKDIKL